MDQLSSCYFCGAALDASLSEYPVVPKSLHPDETDQQTVVLCPTCRRKLATIVESVVDAAEADASVGEPTADEDDQSGLMDESGLGPQPDPMAVGDANESDDSGLLDDEPAAESVSEDESRARETQERTANASDASSAKTANADRSKSDAAADTEDATTNEPSLTRLEYSKVMRLLENREFPVEREGFREVATSAYDIEVEQFDKIVDAAIDRGLIDEENGQFVSAE